MDVPQGARLLSIGEIFDRAINVVLRNIAQLSLAYGLVWLPIRLFIDWLDRSDERRFYEAIGKVIANPRLFSQFNQLTHGPAQARDLSFWGLLTLDLITGALAASLLAIVVARLLRGENADVFRALPQAINRWLRIVLLQSATLLAVTIIALILVLALLVPAAVWAAASGLKVLPTGVTFAVFIALLIEFTVLFLALEAWGYCAFGAIAIDGIGVGRAMQGAWLMTFRKSARLRSLAFGFCIFSSYVLGTLFALAFGGLADLLTHQIAVGVAVRDVLILVEIVFFNAAGIVFYLDAKARYAAIQDAAQNRENSAAR
jgi:hypothetical protein